MDNKDDKLDRSEIKGPLKNNFDKLDTDKDDFLSLAEIKNGENSSKSRPPRGEGRK